MIYRITCFIFALACILNLLPKVDALAKEPPSATAPSEPSSSERDGIVASLKKWQIERSGLPPRDGLPRLELWMKGHPDDAEVLFFLGAAYLTPAFLASDDEAARGLTLVQQAATLGLPAAKGVAASYYLAGPALRPFAEANLILGRKLLGEAMGEQDADSFTIAGWMYADGSCGYDRNSEEAERLFRKSISLGSSRGWKGLAHLAEVDGKSADATKFLQSGAMAGDFRAQATLAKWYMDGKNVPRDMKKAFEWAKKSAEQSCGLAELMLSEFYEEGMGTPKNSREAFVWCKRAAEHREPAAERVLGLSLLGVQGSQAVDDENGLRWMRLAADDGDEGAQFFMGNAYLIGAGVPRDVEKGMKWLQSAAERGDRSAAALIRLMGI